MEQICNRLLAEGFKPFDIQSTYEDDLKQIEMLEKVTVELEEKLQDALEREKTLGDIMKSSQKELDAARKDFADLATKAAVLRDKWNSEKIPEDVVLLVEKRMQLMEVKRKLEIEEEWTRRVNEMEEAIEKLNIEHAQSTLKALESLARDSNDLTRLDLAAEYKKRLVVLIKAQINQ